MKGAGKVCRDSQSLKSPGDIGLGQVLSVSLVKNHLSSFKLGFLNIFSRQNLLRSLSLALFLLQRYKYGAKNVQNVHVRFDFRQSENRKNNRKTFEGASVEPTSKS